MSVLGRLCCKTLCCAANTQLSNPRNRHLESEIARFGSSLNQCCVSGVSKIVLQHNRPIAAGAGLGNCVRVLGGQRKSGDEKPQLSFWTQSWTQSARDEAERAGTRWDGGRTPSRFSSGISYIPGPYSTAQDGDARIPTGRRCLPRPLSQVGRKLRAAFVDSRKTLLRSAVSHRYVCARKPL
jgi:hypothetical protein